MKKLFATILIGSLLTSSVLTGCGSSGSVSRTTETVSSESSKGQSDDSEHKPLKIVKSGYTIAKKDSLGEVYATSAVKIKNPNKKSVPSFWQLTITVKSKDGTVLGTSDDYIPSIEPGATVYMAQDTIDCKKHSDAKLEFTISGSDFDSIVAGENINENDFKTSNVKYIKDEFTPSVTGEVENKSKNDAKSVIVYIIFKKGDKLVGGGSTYVENIPAGGKGAFEYTMLSDVPEHDKVSAVAYRSEY